MKSAVSAAEVYIEVKRNIPVRCQQCRVLGAVIEFIFAAVVKKLYCKMAYSAWIVTESTVFIFNICYFSIWAAAYLDTFLHHFNTNNYTRLVTKQDTEKHSRVFTTDTSNNLRYTFSWINTKITPCRCWVCKGFCCLKKIQRIKYK